MEFRKTSRVALAALIIVGTCFSTTASARSDRHIVRDILLAPLLLPAAIVAASTPRAVVYDDAYYYGRPTYRVEHHRYAPPRHDMRRYQNHRGDGRYTRHYR